MASNNYAKIEIYNLETMELVFQVDKDLETSRQINFYHDIRNAYAFLDAIFPRKKNCHIANQEGCERIVYSSYQNSKFFLRYAQVKDNTPSCGGETFYTEPTGRIVSKGFPMDQYENNLDCKWTLWAPKGYGIRLEFDLIYLEDIGKFQIDSCFLIGPKSNLILNYLRHMF